MNSSNVIFIIGFMASGKSTFGKKLAKKKGYSFVDTDKLIEKEEGKSVTEIFEQYGEKYFRNLEKLALKRLIKQNENQVIATGGGMSCNQYNLNLMKRNGEVIYLKIDVKSVINRLKTAKNKRPILANLSEKELVTKIENLLNKRLKYYNQATVVVNSLEAKKWEG